MRRRAARPDTPSPCRSASWTSVRCSAAALAVSRSRSFCIPPRLRLAYPSLTTVPDARTGWPGRRGHQVGGRCARPVCGEIVRRRRGRRVGWDGQLAVGGCGVVIDPGDEVLDPVVHSAEGRGAACSALPAGGEEQSVSVSHALHDADGVHYRRYGHPGCLADHSGRQVVAVFVAGGLEMPGPDEVPFGRGLLPCRHGTSLTEPASTGRLFLCKPLRLGARLRLGCVRLAVRVAHSAARGPVGDQAGGWKRKLTRVTSTRSAKTNRWWGPAPGARRRGWPRRRRRGIGGGGPRVGPPSRQRSPSPEAARIGARCPGRGERGGLAAEDGGSPLGVDNTSR
jgi:hypothetical protein